MTTYIYYGVKRREGVWLPIYILWCKERGGVATYIYYGVKRRGGVATYIYYGLKRGGCGYLYILWCKERGVWLPIYIMV